jgi:hypothetical protein
MMTKFKSVSAQTPKLMGKNLAKVKGGGDAWPPNCLLEEQSFERMDISSHHCVPQLKDTSSHHCAIPQ